MAKVKKDGVSLARDSSPRPQATPAEDNLNTEVHTGSARKSTIDNYY